MATQQAMYFCANCGKATLHLEKRTSHLLHLFLTIVTAGTWLVVWIWLAAGKSQPRCITCGTAARYRLFVGYRRS